MKKQSPIQTPLRSPWLIFLAAALLLSACAQKSADLTPGAPTRAVVPDESSSYLATPVSMEPAAGICGGTDAALLEVTIYPDIPDPRCALIRTDQRLAVINATSGTLQVSIGLFEATIEPGGEHVFDAPFGTYLAPGVHQLQVLPCCGPALWLRPD
jgi:hypothetical protein